MSVKRNIENSREFAEGIINTVREPLIALDQDLRVVSVSRSFYEVFKVNPEETVGQLIYDLGNKQWDIPKLRKLLETILPEKATFDNYEVEHDFATIGRRTMLLNARQIQRVLGKERIILLAIEDITERKEIEAGLEKTRKELEVTKIFEDAAREFAENIINSVREPLIALDQDLRVVKVSRSFYDFFKVKPEETVGQLIYDLGNKQWDIPKLRKLLETILPEKATFDNYEVEHDFATIGRRTMLLNARQIQRVLGKERIILLAIEDITERKLAEEKLRIAAIVESSKDAIIGKSLDGIITTWNKGAEEIYGYTKSEIIGKSISVLIPPELPDEMTEMLRKIKLGEAISDYETVRRRKDGQDIYVSCTVSAIYDAEGRIVGASTIARDITERKQLENLLKESEMQYRLLFETANDGIVLIEKNEGKIAHINPSFEKMLGYSAKEVIGNKLHNVGLIIDNGDFQITMKKLNKEGILRYNDVPVKTQSGQDIYTDTYLVDKAKFAQCNIRDITERKQAVEALRLSEENFHRSLDESPLGVRVVSKEGETLYANRATLDIFGYDSIEELQTTSTVKRYTEQSYAEFKVRREKRRLDEDDSPEYELDIVRKDGEVRHLQVWRKMVLWNGKDHYQAIYRDITERNRAEETIKTERQRLHDMLEAMPVMVCLLKQDYHVAFANLAFRDKFGESHGRRCYEYCFGKKEPCDFCESFRVLKTKKPHRWQVTTPDGASVIDAYDFPFTDTDGSPLILEVDIDITEHKRAETELRQTLESLRRAVNTTIQVMVSAVEVRDPYTSGHQTRSADLARAIATEMGLSQDKIEAIRMAGSIHDIGKLSIPAEILSKPTKLSDIELRLIREHAHKGFEMLKDVESPWPLAEIVHQHHERMDGSGYPRNMKGEEILIEARILAVADVVEAMASHRPYRPGLGIDAALAEIEKNRGIFYDDTVADTCLRLFREKKYRLAEV